MAEGKRFPKQATLRNTTDEQQVFLYDGLPYIFRPNQEITGLPLEVAGHFIGVHKVGLQIRPGVENDERAIQGEEKRVRDAMPVDHTPGMVDENVKHPLILVEVIDPNVLVDEVTQIISTPVVEKDSEPEFADLTDEAMPVVDKVLSKKG
jgi:hypothetical protein